MKNQKGFTLIELMIVVAIIGILAAIALPAYQDYTVRAKVSECAGIISSCKTSVTEYAASMNEWPSGAGDLAELAGCSDKATQYCTKATVLNTGAIEVTTTPKATPTACTLVLTPQPVGASAAGVTGWKGSTGGSGTACKSNHLPASFR